MRRTVIALGLILAFHAVPAHYGRPPIAPPIETPPPAPASWSATAQVEGTEELTARMIVHGLLRGRGWTPVPCSDEVVLASRDGRGRSYSFCFRHETEHPDTPIVIEQIFRENLDQWEEVGWTEVHDSLGGVYRSRASERRYVIVIIGGYHREEGYTDVILSVAERKS